MPRSLFVLLLTVSLAAVAAEALGFSCSSLQAGDAAAHAWAVQADRR
jgi:hypothetical protein